MRNGHEDESQEEGKVMDTIAIIMSIVAMFLWVRSEANTDRREHNKKHDDISEKMTNLVSAIKADVMAIKDEIRDFHDRLCEIERNRKGK